MTMEEGSKQNWGSSYLPFVRDEKTPHSNAFAISVFFFFFYNNGLIIENFGDVNGIIIHVTTI